MIAVDTNVLIYAHRAESARHSAALAKITALAEGDSAWALPVFCIAEFVRIVTHLRVFAPPTDLDTALEFIDRLLASPTARLLTPDRDFPAIFGQVCAAARVRGNLAFDAQIVAVCIEHGVATLVTADRGIARFRQIATQAL